MKCGDVGRGSHEWKEDGKISESVAKKYNSMMLDGKVRGAVRFATGCGLGGPKQPMDKCSKTGVPVIEILRSKHPKIRIPATVAEGEAMSDVYSDGVVGFEHYPDGAPAVLPSNFDCDVVEKVSGKLNGGIRGQAELILSFSQSGCAMSRLLMQHTEPSMLNERWGLIKYLALIRWQLARSGCVALGRD